MTAKDPWKESKVNSILYINDPMPRIDSQKENKSQNLLRNQCVSKQSTESYKYKISKVLLIRELKIKYISHTKGHYG